ncbi:hypothetical protein BYT27DRAFT_7209416 [Phlegmacium glaucopus]|nr:hypothetical protein BYT27DRAFT_7209416 [Phlegmacium glaucopus]
MVLEITSCLDKADDKAIYDALVQLGLRYRNYLLRVWLNLGRTRQSSPDKIERQKTAHLQALLRDGYKCAISGIYDMQSCLDIEEINTACDALDIPKFIGTEVTHIFSESAQDGDKDYAATVFAILELFDLGKKAEALYGGEVNGLHNAMNKKLMLPDQDLIAIHAVANLSGAAEQVNQILRDMEDTTVLADDGSMAEILSQALRPSMSMP